MKVRHILTGVVIAIAAQGGSQAAELDYQLAWTDEFDGSGVDPAKGSFQIGDGCPDLCGWGNAGIPGKSAIGSGGLLTITARDQGFGGRDYTLSHTGPV